MRRFVVGTAILLLLASMLYSTPAFALPRGRLGVVGTVNAFAVNPVTDIWTLTCGRNGRIYGGTGDGNTESCFFWYDPQSGTWTVHQGQIGLEVFALTTGCDDKIYGGSFKGSDGFGAHFFRYDPINIWSPPINPSDFGRLHTLLGVGPPAAGHENDVMIYDLETGFGFIYGGSGYDQDYGTYQYAYIFRYNPYTNVWTRWQAGGWQAVNQITIGLDGKVYFTYLHGGGHGFLECNPDLTGVFLRGTLPGHAAETWTALTTGIDGKIYYSAGRWLGFYDPSVLAFTTLGDVTGSGIRDLTTGLDGLIYGGDYAGNFFIYAPGKGWNPGTTGRSNPHIFTPVPGEIRIRSLTTGLIGNDPHVYGGTAPGAFLFSYKMYTGDTNNDLTINIIDIAWLAMQFGADPPTQDGQQTTSVKRQVPINTIVAAIVSVVTISVTYYQPKSRERRKQRVREAN